MWLRSHIILILTFFLKHVYNSSSYIIHEHDHKAKKGSKRYRSQRGFVSNFEWWNLAAVFATHLARKLGMFFGILNQTHVANSHSALDQLFRFAGKCVFVHKVLKHITQTTPRKGVTFWPDVKIKWEQINFGCALHACCVFTDVCSQSDGIFRVLHDK